MSGRADHEKRLSPALPTPISAQVEITIKAGVALEKNMMAKLAAIHTAAEMYAGVVLSVF